MRKQIRCKWRSSSRSNEGNKVMYMPQNGLMGFLKEHCKNDLSCFHDILIDRYCFLGILNSRRGDITLHQQWLYFYTFCFINVSEVSFENSGAWGKECLFKKEFQPIVCHIMMRPHYLGLGELFQKASKSETICLTSTYYNIDPQCMIFLILPHLMDLKSLNQCKKLIKCLLIIASPTCQKLDC